MFKHLYVVTSRLTKSRCIDSTHGREIFWSRNYATTQQLLKLRWRHLHFHVEQSLLVLSWKNELSSYTGYWNIRPERQALMELNSYFFHFVLFHFVSFRFTLFLFFLNIGVRCPSHNWSKISSNRAEFLHAHRGVNRVPGDPQGLHSVEGFRSYGPLKWENIFKISSCYFRHVLLLREFLLNK